jgi:hypothetical protein
MATNAELNALLSGMTPDSLSTLINYFQKGGQGDSFIDADRQKLLVKFPPSTAAGQTVRAMYRAIDAGNDPQEVMDDFTAKFDSGEFDRLFGEDGSSLGVLTPDDASEIIGAVSNTAIKRTQAAKSKGTSLDVLKDLGLTELAPLLPALEQSQPAFPRGLTEPSTLSGTYQSILGRLAKEQESLGAPPKRGFSLEEAKSLVERTAARGSKLNVAGIYKNLDSSGKEQFTQKDIRQLIEPVQGVGTRKYQQDQKELLLRAFAMPKDDGGYDKKSKDLQKRMAMAKKAAEEEKRFTEEANRGTLELISQYEANRPKNSTPFDVTKALLMRASKSK